MRVYLKSILFSLLVAVPCIMYGQGSVGIGTTTPDASALLDLVATDKGVLVPRLTTAQRSGIITPADGLLVYDSDTKSFWYFDSTLTIWMELRSGIIKSLVDADGDTKIQVEKNADEDVIRFDLAGSEKMTLIQNSTGQPRLEIGTGSNLAVGYDALLMNDSANGVQNTAVGNLALDANNTGDNNTALGNKALSANTTGNSNTANGSLALYSNTTGGSNTANGYQSLYSNTDGDFNTANGYQSLYFNTTGYYNTANGLSSLYQNKANSRSTAIGYAAMYNAHNTTTGDSTYNTAVGAEALRGSTTPSGNTGKYNTALGDAALYSNTRGSKNVATGVQALYSNTEGSGNIAIGNGALRSNTTLSGLVAIGDSSLYENLGGYYNTTVGFKSLRFNTSGSRNTSVGYQALFSNTQGNENTAFGYQSLFSNKSSNRSTAIGYHAMYYAFSSTFGHQMYNTAVGAEALKGSSTHSDNSGRWNTAIGDAAMYSNRWGNYNTAIGFQALYSNDFGNWSSAAGYQALYSNTSGHSNIANGYQALYSNNSGYSNIAIGIQALYSNTIGQSNIATGNGALYSIVYGSNNSAYGTGALRNTDGDNNVAIGGNSGFFGSHNNCTFVGSSISIGNGGTNRTNVSALGYGIGSGQCTGDDQVLLGNTSISQIRAQVSSITAYSDGRMKTNVTENVPGLAFINKLRPITYRQNPEILHQIWGTPDSLLSKIDHTNIKNKRFIGFIAQEVEQAALDSGFDFPGIDIPHNEKELYSLRYSDFIMPLVKAVQEQQVMIDQLKKENELLKAQSTRVDVLEAELQQIRALLSNQKN